MIQLSDTVSFDETKPIQQQSPEFQKWFFENCPINDKTSVSDYEEYGRPSKYLFTVGVFMVSVLPNYIYPDKSNWAISGYTISIQ